MIDVYGLYIHFPYCIHLCNYCDFYKKKFNNADLSKLEDGIKLNLEKIFTYENFNFKNLRTIYLGGGTPSLWGERGSAYLTELFKSFAISLKNVQEITLEVDPDTWSHESIESWRHFGVNRFSIGVQAYEQLALKMLDRRHCVYDIAKSLDYMNMNRLNYSVDLLIGAPVNNRDVLGELEHILLSGPKHISVYILKPRANYPLKKNIPDDEVVANEYLKVCEKLRENGFIQYEVSNFSKPGYESMHNKAYWRLENILALGPNATGFYQAQKACRYQVSAHTNTFKFEYLSEEQVQLEKMYLSLRSRDGLLLKSFFNTMQINSLSPIIQRWEQTGKISFDGEKIVMNSSGYLVLDSFMDDIFKYT